ncbi:hypothetical protein [Sedimenticola sp.]|uniref:hypothetical protein n=1 Tax=Sedimenticola sp. TaxID=1940285 RepID=UPI003D10A881
MNILILFILEVIICISISFVIIRLLKPLLTDVLIETCGTKQRAAFWAMFTQLMIYLAPLLIVVYFAPTSTLPDGGWAFAIKNALFRTLLGAFIALASVGQVIWKSITVLIPKQANLAIPED